MAIFSLFFCTPITGLFMTNICLQSTFPLHSQQLLVQMPRLSQGLAFIPDMILWRSPLDKPLHISSVTWTGTSGPESLCCPVACPPP